MAKLSVSGQLACGLPMRFLFADSCSYLHHVGSKPPVYMYICPRNCASCADGGVTLTITLSQCDT
jgi:hypothetical protein